MAQAPNLSQEDLYSVVTVARRLGIDPNDLMTIIGYESAGSYSPSKQGGKNNDYTGLIQFGPAARKEFSASGKQTFPEQMEAVYRYLKAKGVKPGMDARYIYAAVNAGKADEKRFGWSDRPGATVASHVNDMMNSPYRTNAVSMLKGLSPTEPNREGELPAPTIAAREPPDTGYAPVPGFADIGKTASNDDPYGLLNYFKELNKPKERPETLGGLVAQGFGSDAWRRKDATLGSMLADQFRSKKTEDQMGKEDRLDSDFNEAAPESYTDWIAKKKKPKTLFASLFGQGDAPNTTTIPKQTDSTLGSFLIQNILGA